MARWIGVSPLRNPGEAGMGRFIALAFGTLSYTLFLLSFLYLIGFLANAVVPKGIDTGESGSVVLSLLINLGLFGLFSAQHSIMARPAFKAWWTGFVSRSVERSTYVLLTSLILFLLFWLWQPLPQLVWKVDTVWLRSALWALFAGGLGIVLLSTFIIDHFELFGLRQVWCRFRQKDHEHPRFQVRFFYRFVRHPLYSGFLIAFWATPEMSIGHLFFAAVFTAYILLAVGFEERDLTAMLGDGYARYVQSVPMLIPRRTKVHEVVKPGATQNAAGV